MKKRTVLLILGLLLALSLCGCGGAKAPTRAADGAGWDESWTQLGSVLGVEDPGSGFALLDNNLALIGDDTYLAIWGSGDPTPFVNEDGDDAEFYEAQIYLLAMGCKDADSARAAVEDWIGRERGTYSITDERAESLNGQEFTLLLYQTDSDTNPYGRGMTAFTVFGHYAVSAELSCLDDYAGDESAILTAFLNGCHFNADLDEG